MRGCTCGGVLPWLRAEQEKGFELWEPGVRVWFEVGRFLEECRGCGLHLVVGERAGVFVLADAELRSFRVGETVELVPGASRPASQGSGTRGG